MMYRSTIINVKLPMVASWIHVVAMSSRILYAYSADVVGYLKFVFIVAITCGTMIKPVDRSEVTRLDSILLDTLLRSFGFVRISIKTRLFMRMMKVDIMMSMFSVLMISTWLVGCTGGLEVKFLVLLLFFSNVAVVDRVGFILFFSFT